MINEQIQGHVDAAQEHRRKARKLLAAGDRESATSEFEVALSKIRAGLTRLRQEEPPDATDPTEQDRELATFFAELLGIQGGTYRDMVPLDPEHADRAIKAYDEGASYERDFVLKSTYNFVNQLVLRFVATPKLLVDLETALTLDGRDGSKTDSVAGWLRRADELVSQSYSRRDDPAWALADLVLLAALQSSSELSSRRARFESQVKRDRDTYPYVSLERVVRDLRNVTPPTSPIGETLCELDDWLGARIPSP